MAPPAALLALSLCLGLAHGSISLPLRIFSGSYNLSSALGLVALRRAALAAEGTGLSLASDPAGTVNFVDMVQNLQGDSGRGYYLQMAIGTPAQKVPSRLHRSLFKRVFLILLTGWPFALCGVTAAGVGEPGVEGGCGSGAWPGPRQLFFCQMMCEAGCWRLCSVVLLTCTHMMLPGSS